jgi:hypothetical protein
MNAMKDSAILIIVCGACTVMVTTALKIATWKNVLLNVLTANNATKTKWPKKIHAGMHAMKDGAMKTVPHNANNAMMMAALKAVLKNAKTIVKTAMNAIWKVIMLQLMPKLLTPLSELDHHHKVHASMFANKDGAKALAKKTVKIVIKMEIAQNLALKSAKLSARNVIIAI